MFWIVEDWFEDLRSVDRINFGVFYIRDVKEIFGMLIYCKRVKKFESLCFFYF